MRAWRRLGSAFLGVFLLTGMLHGESTQGGGIEGIISFSPSKPGPMRKGEESSAPAGKIEFVVRKGDTRVASFTTDEAGRFRISLPPGHYIVLREDSGSSAGHWRFEVDVTAGDYKKVMWAADSGMR